MSYTRLRLSADGIVLCRYHERRLGLDPAGRAALCRFARTAAPGVWVLRLAAEGRLQAAPAGASALRDGLPVRCLSSPVADRRGPVAKCAPPSPYDAVRQSGVVSLLLSTDGLEIYESCRSAVLAWDGARLVCPPEDRPRVWSTAEAAVREHLAPREAPLRLDADLPLLLINAVVGTCALSLPGRPPFPARERERIEALLRAQTAWPAGPSAPAADRAPGESAPPAV